MEQNVEEIIRDIPKGLLHWHDFEPGAEMLYIGNKDDAFAAVLADLDAALTCVGVEESVSEEMSAKYKGNFDYLVSVGSLELAEHPQETLARWRELIKPSGKMWLGMNNRLGIRYFCGDRDIYTGRVLDGIEGYRRAYMKKEDVFAGRSYSKSEIKGMIAGAGWEHTRFYSVLPDLEHPQILYEENYTPNEDLSNRLMPAYNYPGTVFLEEEQVYNALVENGMFHAMANAFLVECSMQEIQSDVVQVTNTIERGREKACFTILHGEETVEKKAVYPEGIKQLAQMAENLEDLKRHGISVVEGSLKGGAYVMPYIKAESAQKRLRRLFFEDREAFLAEMDRLHALLMQSSDIEQEDCGDGTGAILRRGYFDMMPINCFYVDGEYTFIDQEYYLEHCPLKLLMFRMIWVLYAGEAGMQKAFPADRLYERYGILEQKEQWQKQERDLLDEVRNDTLLCSYHQELRRNADTANSNRQRMNYSQEDYERLFVNIFDRADTRKLILFGSGRFAKKFIDLYGTEYPVYAVADNNEEMWGQEIEGIEIHPPEYLKTLAYGEYKVIICIKNYVSVMKQLDGMGIRDYSIYDSGRAYPRRRQPLPKPETDEQAAPKKYNIGYVAGVFDMFHAGHVNLLRRAKELCSYLIVGVVPDETVYRQKEKYPVIPCADRVDVLKACKYADQVEVLPLDYAGIRDAYKLFHFDVQFSGDDHGGDERWLEEKEFLRKNGADIVFFPYTEGVSSTMLREKLARQEGGRR